MAKLLVIQGEGPTEKSFLQSLLIQHGFLTSEKSPEVFLKEDSLILIAPCFGMSKKTGKSSLVKKCQYRKLPQIVRAVSKLNSITVDEYHLVITFDTEMTNANYQQTLETIKKSAETCFSCVGTTNVFPVKGTIENWFCAGLDNSFTVPLKNQVIFTKYVNHPKPDTIDGVKDNFYECFSDPYGVTVIASKIGDSFNIELAKQLSPSFCEYIEHIESICGQFKKKTNNFSI